MCQSQQSSNPRPHRVAYVSDMQERSRFLKAVTLAREAYENRRRKFPGLLAEDHTTIAAAVLKKSFWQFSDYPLCSIVSKAGRYPCNLSFPNRYTIEIPRYAGSHWDFLHQLAHWCMPLEGHNETFCTFYAVLVDAAFGKDGRRRLIRAYKDCELSHMPSWLEPVGHRLEPADAESGTPPACSRDHRYRRYGT